MGKPDQGFGGGGGSPEGDRRRRRARAGCRPVVKHETVLRLFDAAKTLESVSRAHG